MIRPTVRDKLLPDALRQGLLQSVLVFALSAARVGGIYAPWALAAAAVSGGKSRGLWALLGAGVGALVFFDFQTGLRFAASAVLIYSANMAFCDTKMYARKGFAPLLAALALLLVQSVYLVGRSAAQWALGVSASAVAAAVACGLDESRENSRLHLLVVMTAAAAALSAVQVEGFSPGSMTAAWLALLCAVLERALRRRAGADASLLWIPERLRPMLHRSGGFLRRTRRLWLVWLAWAVLLAGLWFLADGQLDQVLAPWIARYGEELVQSGFPESWTILRGRLEADVALWLRLRQGVLIAGAVSGAGVLVWTLLHWKKRRPPLAEEGET